MRSEHRIETEHDLLDGDGLVTEPGYCFKPLLRYERAMIKAPKFRIKEWDYYMITCDESAVAFTVSDQTYALMDTLGFMDFTVPRADTLRVCPIRRDGRAYGAPGEPVDHSIKNGKFSLDIRTAENKTHITAHAPDFCGGKFDADITLYNNETDSMVIVTPFDKPKYFYYNLKTNCIDAEGYVIAHGREYEYVRGRAYACYDCGRGAWTRKNTWLWTTLSANVNGYRFGMNLGYGFGDTSAATENMLFMDGVAHKLGDVKIDIPESGGKMRFMAGDWRMTDGDGRLDLIFKPIVVRHDALNAVFVTSLQNQTFGAFYGTAVLDDGQTVKLNGEIGACEVFKNNG